MTINRGLIFWGLALVTGGVVALAAQLGYIDRNALAGAWRLWPLVLIAIGLSIILARTGLALVGTIAAALVVGFAGGALIAVGSGNVACGGSEPAQLSERHGSFSSDLSDAGIVAAVKVEFDCGTLDVAMAKSRSWTVASGNGAAQPQVAADANSLSVSSRSDRWWGKDRQHWEISLPIRKSYELLVEPNAADTSLDLAGGGFQRLNVHPNAGSLRLDLRGARVEQLDLALNAGSVSIVVDEGSRISGSLHVNAGSIELCTDGFAALGLTVKENITFSTNLASSGLSRAGDTWTNSSISGPRPYFDELTIEGNAGSFTLNPEGGCA